MIGDALRFPRSGDGWLERIVIGGVFVILSFLIVPLILIEGFLYRVLRDVSQGNESPPAWEDWAELFVDGIKMYVVQIVYLLIPAIVMVLGITLLGFGLVGGPEVGILGALILFVGLALALVMAYFIPAGLTHLARSGQLGAAFRFRAVAKTAFNTAYFVPVFLSLLLAIVLGIIGSILLAIVVGVFVLFYAQVAVAFLWARGVAASTP